MAIFRTNEIFSIREEDNKDSHSTPYAAAVAAVIASSVLPDCPGNKNSRTEFKVSVLRCNSYSACKRLIFPINVRKLSTAGVAIQRQISWRSFSKNGNSSVARSTTPKRVLESGISNFKAIHSSKRFKNFALKYL